MNNKFIELTDTVGVKVYINSLMICSLKEHVHGCEIFTMDRRYTSVKENVKEVLTLIEKSNLVTIINK